MFSPNLDAVSRRVGGRVHRADTAAVVIAGVSVGVDGGRSSDKALTAWTSIRNTVRIDTLKK